MSIFQFGFFDYESRIPYLCGAKALLEFMISRRNIRVKVMQTLYSLESSAGSAREEGPTDLLPLAGKQLQQHLDQTSRIFIFLLYNTAEVARYALKDARQRASRYLHSKDDPQVDTRIAVNGVVERLINDAGFAALAARQNVKHLADEEIIKKIYLQLVPASEYQEYLDNGSGSEKEDKKVMLFIFRELLMKNEAFDQQMEDLFIHWADDREMMNILVNNYFNKPGSFDFNQLISKEKEQYGSELLETVIDKRDLCQELIRPKLQNWDADRIAAVDMLLMRMGLCEFLYFPTIPTKVTINEYIDLAKTYSTPQSGQFVNGILDNILKDLKNENKIRKTDRIKK